MTAIAATPALLGASALAWTLGIVVLGVLFLLWLYCLFDILVNREHGGGWKAVWILLMIVLAPFAIVAYLLFGRRRQGTSAVAS